MSDKSLSPWHGKTVRNHAKRFADQVTVGEDQRSIFIALKFGSGGGGRLWGAWYKLPVQFFGELGALGQNVGTIVIQFAIFAGPFLDVGPRASRCGQTQSCKTLKTFGWETKQDNPHLRKCEALLQQYHAICHLQFVLASYKWVEYRHFIPTSSSAPCEVRDH